MQRTIWVHGDATLSVYEEDPTSTSDPPALIQDEDEEDILLLAYCFLQGVTINASAALERRGVPGRGRRKLICRSGKFDDVSMEVEHLFFRKTTELDFDDIFNPEKQLRLVLEFFKPEYSGTAPFENDTISLAWAKAEAVSISSRDNDNVTASASFQAEKIF